MTFSKRQQSRPPLHPPPSPSLRKPLTIEANTFPRNSAAASTSPRLQRRPFVITPPRKSVLSKGAHQQHDGPDGFPTPKLSNTFEGYSNRLLLLEKEKKERKNAITGVPISTYEVDSPSTPSKIHLPTFLDSPSFQQDNRITSPYFTRSPSSNQNKLLESAKERLTDNSELILAKKTDTSGQQRKSSRRHKHKKKSRRASPGTTSTQNTSPSSTASQFSENMIQAAGESSIQQIPNFEDRHSSSVLLTDMFSWGHASGPSGKMKKTRSSRRPETQNQESSSSSSPRKTTSKTRSQGDMWQGDDEKSIISVSPRSRPSWQDDNTLVSGTSTLRLAPLWQGDKQNDPVQAKSPQPKVTTQHQLDETMSGTLSSLRASSSRAARPRQDAKSSPTSGMARSRPAPMWREEETKSTRSTLQITTSVANPRPEKDYRQFFEELSASYTDDLFLVKDDKMQGNLRVHLTEEEKVQQDFPTVESGAEKEDEDNDDYRQFFEDLSDSNELVFQDARTYAENWKCPASVESSVSDESAQDAVQFCESLEESLKSESALNNSNAGGKSAAKRFVQRFTGRTIFRGPSVNNT